MSKLPQKGTYVGVLLLSLTGNSEWRVEYIRITHRWLGSFRIITIMYIRSDSGGRHVPSSWWKLCERNQRRMGMAIFGKEPKNKLKLTHTHKTTSFLHQIFLRSSLSLLFLSPLTLNFVAILLIYPSYIFEALNVPVTAFFQTLLVTLNRTIMHVRVFYSKRTLLPVVRIPSLPPATSTKAIRFFLNFSSRKFKVQ